MDEALSYLNEQKIDYEVLKGRIYVNDFRTNDDQELALVVDLNFGYSPSKGSFIYG